ncbi:50S ribosomal protein L24 [Candidatus Berkelbacteria bacterium]|nr:50S ribosomal protein L24 [Candidatus Berkelbacteria bacterium]
MKLIKGDKVLVIAGKERGKVGVIERVIVKDKKIVINGLNIVKKTLKKTAQNPQGGFAEVAMPIHISNVMLLDNKNKPSRVGKKIDGKKLVRFAITTKELISKTEKK